MVLVGPDLDYGFNEPIQRVQENREYKFDDWREGERFKLCCSARSVIYPELRMKQRHNAEYEPSQLLSFLTHAAFTNDFVNDTAETYPLPEEAPHSNTIFYRIRNLSVEEILEQFDSAIERVIEIAIEKGALRGEVNIAIDITDWRYYGDKNDPMVVLTQPKKGTNRAFLLATVYAVVDGERFTLKAIPMGSFDTKEDILEDLLDYAEEIVNIGTLYVDRAFFTTDCIKVIQEKGVKFLMPATKSKRVREEAEKGAPRIIDFEYGVNREDPVNFNLGIVEDEEGKVRTFATNHEVEENELEKLFDMYSLRWGIETSYRVKHMFRAKTRTKKYEPRIFLFLFSVCLYNLWVLVNFKIAKRFGADSKFYMTAKAFTKRMVDAFPQPEPPPINCS